MGERQEQRQNWRQEGGKLGLGEARDILERNLRRRKELKRERKWVQKGKDSGLSCNLALLAVDL